MSESISNAHDATVYERGRAHGINEERRAIVAWLREYDSRQPGFHNMRVTRNVANDIEHGDHLRDDDE